MEVSWKRLPAFEQLTCLRKNIHVLHLPFLHSPAKEFADVTVAQTLMKFGDDIVRIAESSYFILVL